MLPALLAAALFCCTATAPAHAARIRDCPGLARGGGWRNVTTRVLMYRQALPVVIRIVRHPQPCWPAEPSLGSCSYGRGIWSVRGHWFHDRYGLDQLDLRATASGGRVVRLQTDWDGE